MANGLPFLERNEERPVSFLQDSLSQKAPPIEPLEVTDTAESGRRFKQILDTGDLAELERFIQLGALSFLEQFPGKDPRKQKILDRIAEIRSPEFQNKLIEQNALSNYLRTGSQRSLSILDRMQRAKKGPPKETMPFLERTRVEAGLEAAQKVGFEKVPVEAAEFLTGIKDQKRLTPLQKLEKSRKEKVEARAKAEEDRKERMFEIKIKKAAIDLKKAQEGKPGKKTQRSPIVQNIIKTAKLLEERGDPPENIKAVVVELFKDLPGGKGLDNAAIERVLNAPIVEKKSFWDFFGFGKENNIEDQKKAIKRDFNAGKFGPRESPAAREEAKKRIRALGE
jgi:hypothetical protein